MAINANEANITALRSNRKTKSVKVIVLPKLEPQDFVHVAVGNEESRIARILDIISSKVHVKFYWRRDELPCELKSHDSTGDPITLESFDLVEDGTSSENIPIKQVLRKCWVTFGSKRETFAMKKRSNCSEEMYVCRYKLVKETIYKLEPIGWRRSEGRKDSFLSEHDEYDYNGSKISDIDNRIGQLFLSANKKQEPTQNQLVSPIKIVNNLVHRVPRSEMRPNRNYIGSVSPTKRAKFEIEQNSNIQTDLPELTAQRKSHHQRNLIKRNLCSSFMDFQDEPFDEEEQNYNIVEMSGSGQSMKITLKKTKSTRYGPLQELHDNTSSDIQLPDKEVKKAIIEVREMPTPTMRRKSILKISGSGTGMREIGSPIRTVRIFEDSSTPSLQSDFPTRRRSTRVSSMNASVMIKLNLTEISPETKTKHSLTPKLSKPGRTSVPRNSVSSKTLSETPGSLRQGRQLFRSGNLVPSIEKRETLINHGQNELSKIRERLHVSTVPQSLPCRENEFQNIYSFIRDKVIDKCGGCIYISGVPGTGKTATATSVIRALQLKATEVSSLAFDFVEINGMRLTEPRQAYVQIYRQLTGKTVAWAQARDLLEATFTGAAGKNKSRKSTVLLLDELDIICNRKQDVVYNLFDWTTIKNSCLIAVTIANTMDLPERVLKLKVASRLGLTRITFQPYTFKQLQEVVIARLSGTKSFVSDAVQLVARKVASVSGDCRRALDICRRAAEITEKSSDPHHAKMVKLAHVDQALKEMFASPKVQAIKCCNIFEKLFLQAVASEINRTGVEEVDFKGVFIQMETLASVLGIKNPPNQTQALRISSGLGASRLIIVEDSMTDIYQKIILNVSIDDLYYAIND